MGSSGASPGRAPRILMTESERSRSPGPGTPSGPHATARQPSGRGWTRSWRRWPPYGVAALGLLALVWWSYRGIAGWQFHAQLERANREIAAGRYRPARQRLEALAARWPGRAEVDYPL